MSQITYADKVALTPQTGIADINKVTNDDMNEIKNAHNDTDNKVSELMNIEYCVATISSQQTAGSNYHIQLNSIDSTNSNMFSLSNGDIKIGAGVNKIRVSATVFVEGLPANSYVWARIDIKNSNEQTKQQITCISNGFGNGTAFTSTVLSERIIEVEQGDIIRLAADSPSGGTIRANANQTWVQVEKIN